MNLLQMIREARAKPINHRADMIEALVLVAVALFAVGLIVGLGVSR